MHMTASINTMSMSMLAHTTVGKLVTVRAVSVVFVVLTRRQLHLRLEKVDELDFECERCIGRDDGRAAFNTIRQLRGRCEPCTLALAHLADGDVPRFYDLAHAKLELERTATLAAAFELAAVIKLGTPYRVSQAQRSQALQTHARTKAL